MSGSAPADKSLLPQQFFYDGSGVGKLWVGVPTAVNASGKLLFLDNADVQNKVPLGGGTMTGPLILSADPTNLLGAATKQYVDSKGPLGGPYLLLTGGTLSGAVTVQSGLADPNGPKLFLKSTANAIWPGVEMDTTSISGPGGGAAGYIATRRNGLSRWTMEIGGADAESGSNVGTNFGLRPFNDNGSPQSMAVTISRTGVGALYGQWSVNGAFGIKTGAGGWSAWNVGKQLLIDGTGSNTAIGMSDSSGANYVGILNVSGVLQFLSMPLPTDTTTTPDQRLNLSATAATFYKPVTATAALTVQGLFSISFNSQTVPPAVGGGSLLWNFSGGGGEVAFFNGGNGGNPGFDWRRVTGAGTSMRLAYLDANGKLTTTADAAVGGNGITYTGIGPGHQIGFGWTGSAIQTYVDGSGIGSLVMGGPYLALTGGTLTNTLSMNSTSRVTFNGGSQFVGSPNIDGASLSNANIQMGSFNGIGFTNGGPAGQQVPVGLNGIVFDARSGNIAAQGVLYIRNKQPSSIQNVRFVNTAGFQQITVDDNLISPALTSSTPAAGGSGCAVNDRFYDAYNNIYTATAVSGGAVTTIQMDVSSVITSAVPGNPVALTAAPGFSGTGVTVNLTWTQGVANFSVQNITPGGKLTLNGSAGVQVVSTIGFNNTTPIAKPTVSGAKGSNAALASLVTALASYGLITDSTTA